MVVMFSPTMCMIMMIISPFGQLRLSALSSRVRDNVSIHIVNHACFHIPPSSLRTREILVMGMMPGSKRTIYVDKFLKVFMRNTMPLFLRTGCTHSKTNKNKTLPTHLP